MKSDYNIAQGHSEEVEIWPTVKHDLWTFRYEPIRKTVFKYMYMVAKYQYIFFLLKFNINATNMVKYGGMPNVI